MHYKSLVIGTGSIGSRHVRNLLKLGYKNISVCEPDNNKHSAILELGKFKLYKDVKAALKKEVPNIVFVCNPTHLHVPTASLALDNGAHVFIEKPVSHDLKGVDALIKKAAQKKKTVMVACNYRFHSGFKELKKAVYSKKYGIPVLSRVVGGYHLPSARKGVDYKKVYAASTKGGGVIIDSGAHSVDYLKNLFGSVSTTHSTIIRSNVLSINSEEAAALILGHKSGVVSNLSLDYISKKPIHKIEVVTDKGLLALDVIGNTLTFEDEKLAVKKLFNGNKDLNQMFVDEIKHFMNSVKAGEKPAQSLIEAKNTLKVLLAAHKSKPQLT